MIIGIDLGTTNSLVSVWQDGAPRLIENSLGDTLTPSCVSVDEDGTILVGRAAHERLQTHPDKTAAVFKRYMGSNHTLRVGTHSFRPEELSSLVLKSLKADAEAFLGEPVTDAIITVPAYFSDAQRKATRTAGQLAGLNVERLLNEPTAAALAYGIHQRDAETRFMVFDLGGGTFDISILELFEGVMEVRATAGDTRLGGEDFVEAIILDVLREHGLPANIRREPTFAQVLYAQAEQLKRALSREAQASLTLRHAETEYSSVFDEARLEKICAPLLARLRDPAERALRDAGIRSADLDNIVLAGGATRMPIVRRLVARLFGRMPACSINPDEVVALGAAVQAGLRMKDAALREMVMTDVAPYSMGIAISMQTGPNTWSEGHFSPIIERNTPVPVSRVEQYFPAQEGQRHLDLRIYQGEARMVRDNIALGTLHLPLPSLVREKAGVDVRFTYDVNGLLEVEATLRHTGDVRRLVIEENPGLLSEAEIAERMTALASLKIHPREQMDNRHLLARAERIYQLLRGDTRDWLGQQISLFENVLDGQDPARIAESAARLSEVLEQIEKDCYLGQEW